VVQDPFEPMVLGGKWLNIQLVDKMYG